MYIHTYITSKHGVHMYQITHNSLVFKMVNKEKASFFFSYCTNISFYMMLKSKQVPVHNHPVIKRLVQHRNVSLTGTSIHV